MDRSTEKYLCNVLRQASITWSGRTECLNRARIQVVEGKLKNGKDKLKWYWKCASCKELFRNQTDMEVDHIIEIGPYQGCLHKYAQRIFCDQSNLQALCIGCHQRKTSGFNASLKFQRKSR